MRNVTKLGTYVVEQLTLTVVVVVVVSVVRERARRAQLLNFWSNKVKLLHCSSSTLITDYVQNANRTNTSTQMQGTVSRSTKRARKQAQHSTATHLVSSRAPEFK